MFYKHVMDECTALQMCRWAGRNQVVELGSVTYYLDGAHTPESVEASRDWFLSEIMAARCHRFESFCARGALSLLLYL